MLDVWIIEELRRIEQEKDIGKSSYLELPMTEPDREYKRPDKKEESDRGVFIIDINNDTIDE